VIGAGVIGLSSACRVQDELPNVDVTVISDEFSPNTTGDGSAGFWRPYYVEGTPDKLIWKWGKDTFEHLYSLSMTAEGGTLGIFQCSGYDIYWNNQQEAFWKDIVFGYRSMTTAELGQFGDKYRCGYAYTTMMCECKTYLPWLLKRFTSKGGKCIQHKVEKLTDLVGKYDVIVNCPGAQRDRGTHQRLQVRAQAHGCSTGRFRKMQGPVETEYSSTALPAMQGSVETRSASEVQPEKEPRGASREVHGR
jgi:glycine/D-amino acid oxidase-like deaminating enzyme